MLRIIFGTTLCALIALVMASTPVQAQNSVKMLQGKVVDATTKTPVKGGMVTLLMSTHRDTTLIRRARVNSKSGRYQIVVEPAEVYSFLAEAPGYYSAEIVAVPKEDGYEEIESNMAMMAAPVGDTAFKGGISLNDRNMVINNSQFEEATARIRKNRGLAYKISMELPVDVKSAMDQTGPSFEQRYLNALKEYMLAHDISSMRLTWEVVSTDVDPATMASAPKNKNVMVSILTNGAAEIPKDE